MVKRPAIGKRLRFFLTYFATSDVTYATSIRKAHKGFTSQAYTLTRISRIILTNDKLK